MCGRFVLSEAAADLVPLFDIDDVGSELPRPSWNIAPGSRVHVMADAVARDDEFALPRRRLESARWGLVPSWVDDPASGAPITHARIETLTQERAFADAFQRRRAAVPATGYYEWLVAADGSRRPRFVSDPGGSLVVFAGLFEWWRDRRATGPTPWHLSTTIVTMPAGGALRGLNERMPVFLQPELLDDWLDPTSDGEVDLLHAAAAGAVDLAEGYAHHEVSGDLLTAGADEPRLTHPV